MNKYILCFVINAVLNIAASAYDFEQDGLYYNITSEGDLTVECCGGGQSSCDKTYRKTEVVIPETVIKGAKKYTVTKIADYAWGNCVYVVWIQKLTLPNTIKEIGVCAFRDANNITDMNIPMYLETIGDGALDGPHIQEYMFPKTLKRIGKRVFNRRLKTVVFLSATTPILDEETFLYQNGGPNDLYLPDGFRIYVPNKNSFGGLSVYSDYITSIVDFENTEYSYTGMSPELQFANNLPNNHTFNLSPTNNIPSNAGSYEILLKGQIDNLYEIDVPIELIINKASLKIVAKNAEREYGEKNPIFDADISGLQNGEKINDVIVGGYKLMSLTTSRSNVGDYPIRLYSTESLNYNIDFTEGNLTIHKAPLQISVLNCSREYGVENPQFTLTYIGLKNNETQPEWEFEPVFSTEANIHSDVGVYSVAVNCSPKNYNIDLEYGQISISKAPLFLKVNDESRLYYEENPEFKFSLFGLRNGDYESCLSSTPTFICAATIGSDCGQYDIIPSSAEAKNYEIEYKKGVLTINPDGLTLVASDISREYGELNPVLKYEAVGLKGDDDMVSCLDQEPILTTNAIESSNAGEYVIQITGGSSKNYRLSYRSGILTVKKAPLTVIAENAERMYGDDNPTFTRSYLGFKLSDTELTAFSVLPKFMCLATKTSDVGTYTITIAGGTSRNYNVLAYESGTLTVTKASLVLSANDKSRLYYEDNPTFDFSLTGLRNGDQMSCINVAPKYECQANKSSSVGNYAVIPYGADAKNYSIEYRNGVLNISPRQLTASVGNYSKIYGADNPEFNIVYNGFVNNEDKSMLTSQVIATCSARKDSDVGAYPIALSEGNAVNYTISEYNNGILSIEKANQTLTWDQDLSNVPLYSQLALEATSSSGLPITYEMSPNNVAILYYNGGKWYLDCYGSGAVNIRALQNGDKNHNAASIISKTLVVIGSGGGSSDPQIYLNVETAGTLPTLIAENRKFQIKNLRLSGYLNGTDIDFLREMAGSDSYGNATLGVLETLDISNCTIISGGRSYYNFYRTSNYKVSDYMFYNCRALANLLLPDNTETIGNGAFADCERLSVIAIPNGVVSFGQQAFNNCISLLRIPMPNKLMSIGKQAFMGCNGITEITIPISVSYLGDRIVVNCQNLERVNVEQGNTNFASTDGVLYTSSLDELLIYPVAHIGDSYEVLGYTTRIAPFAFINAKKLKNLTLPETVASIGNDAFIGCVNLTTLQVQAIKPPICDNDCFESVSKTRCELQVPQGCYSYYWVAPVWSDFNKIIETDFGGIGEVELEQQQVNVDGCNINIKAVVKGRNIRIFQADGSLLYQNISDGNDVRYQPSANGIYIIAIDNQTYKVAVR